MRVAIAVVLIIVGVVFAANVLGTLTGRYGPARRAQNALIAGAVSAAAFGVAVFLLT